MKEEGEVKGAGGSAGRRCWGKGGPRTAAKKATGAKNKE